jgi:hypothetical protein
MPTQSHANDGAYVVFFVICGILGLGLYVLPTIIAAMRGHPNLAPIVVINILLGWSLLGWAACLAWSLIQLKPITMNLDLRVNPSGPAHSDSPRPPPLQSDDWLDHLK